MGVGAVMAGSAVLSSISASKSAKAQASAAKSASNAETALGYANLDLQEELAAQQREDFAPWRDVGEQALDKLWSSYEAGNFDVGAFDSSSVDVTQDPGYAFRMQQGVDALDSSASARGRLSSGAQQKALTEYGQNVGSQEYSNAYARALNEHSMSQDRATNNYNMLSGLSAAGQSSAAQQAASTSQLASSSSNILSNIGQSQANAAYNVGNANASAYSGVATAANQGMQNWLLQKNLGG